MDDVFTRQQEVMERSGLGLLPGIAIAFVLALLMIAAILAETWWSVALALAGVLGVTVVVLVVFVRLLFRSED